MKEKKREEERERKREGNVVVRALELSRHASPPLFPPLFVPARYPRLSASIKPLDHFSCSLAACVWIRHCRRDSRSRKHRGADRRRNFLRNISNNARTPSAHGFTPFSSVPHLNRAMFRNDTPFTRTMRVQLVLPGFYAVSRPPLSR